VVVGRLGLVIQTFVDIFLPLEEPIVADHVRIVSFVAVWLLSSLVVYILRVLLNGRLDVRSINLQQMLLVVFFKERLNDPRLVPLCLLIS